MNTRLISVRWRYLPRPSEGDVVYTDYYGAVGGGWDHCNYYGRSYHHNGAKEFERDRMVEDEKYEKMRAGMNGIHTLRARNGLAVEQRLAHSSDPATLMSMRPQSASASIVTKGLHHITDFSRMRPQSASASIVTKGLHHITDFSRMRPTGRAQ
eukprot:gene29363-12454_t